MDDDKKENEQEEKEVKDDTKEFDEKVPGSKDERAKSRRLKGIKMREPSDSAKGALKDYKTNVPNAPK